MRRRLPGRGAAAGASGLRSPDSGLKRDEPGGGGPAGPMVVGGRCLWNRGRLSYAAAEFFDASIHFPSEGVTTGETCLFPVFISQRGDRVLRPIGSSRRRRRGGWCSRVGGGGQNRSGWPAPSRSWLRRRGRSDVRLRRGRGGLGGFYFGGLWRGGRGIRGGLGQKQGRRLHERDRDKHAQGSQHDQVPPLGSRRTSCGRSG